MVRWCSIQASSISDMRGRRCWNILRRSMSSIVGSLRRRIGMRSKTCSRRTSATSCGTVIVLLVYWLLAGFSVGGNAGSEGCGDSYVEGKLYGRNA
ncbi:hypothetical protein GALMADRAFT_604168 [Galerina marginata CBS 339.88]|uniref:Transmembrane protein n=1 Tax=Galerina marginata (strain CBS 339.88) TaxID=685588 RepID=A0A067SVM6_GALM3|nr:hypothetical protein GALMADRAFT_604168 [Galerina marginata CBS 339.88]